MKLDVQVLAYGRQKSVFAGVEVPEPFIEAFAPLNTCDCLEAAIITGDTLADDESVHVVRRLRQDAAQELSETLADMLLNAMQQEDTHNGYSK